MYRIREFEIEARVAGGGLHGYGVGAALPGH